MSFDDKNVPRAGVESRLAANNLNEAVLRWALRDAYKLRRSCGSCVYANLSGPFKCSVYNAVPPIDVIMNGCESYSDTDDIPF